MHSSTSTFFAALDHGDVPESFYSYQSSSIKRERQTIEQEISVLVSQRSEVLPPQIFK